MPPPPLRNIGYETWGGPRIVEESCSSQLYRLLRRLQVKAQARSCTYFHISAILQILHIVVLTLQGMRLFDRSNGPVFYHIFFTGDCL
ncbi:hypothetical protein BDV18DRAFT_99900 [Aspergillus unguis]